MRVGKRELRRESRECVRVEKMEQRRSVSREERVEKECE